MVKKPQTVNTTSVVPSSKKIKKPLPTTTPKAEIHKPLVEDYPKFIEAKEKAIAKGIKELKAKINIDKSQISKAVTALTSHLKVSSENSKNLLYSEEEEFIYIEIATTKVPTSLSIRPIQIPLKNPLYSAALKSKHAIIVKDPQRSFKDKIQNLGIPTIAKVIGVSKLTSNYPTFSDKRSLANEFDLFFCDYKIYNNLRKPLGKAFYEKKKFPFPIDCENVPENLKSKFDYAGYLNSLASASYFIPGNGPTYVYKIGRLSMSTNEIVDNVLESVYFVIANLVDGGIEMENIEQISIKSSKSMSLPFYNFLTTKALEAFNGTN